MKLEYQKIVDDVCNSFGVSKDWSRRIGTKVAEHCEAFADKPVKELTDDEIDAVFNHQREYRLFARNVIAAHIAKQTAPEVRKVKIRVWLNTQSQSIRATDDVTNCLYPYPYMLLEEFEHEVKV